MYIIWIQQKLILFLSRKFAAKFTDMFLIFKSNEKVTILINQTTLMCSFQEKKNASSLSTWRNVLTLQTPHRNFLMLCQMVLLPNINFLISKQNKTPKIDPKVVKQ